MQTKLTKQSNIKLCMQQSKALIYMQNIIPLHANTTKHTYKVDNKDYFIRNDKHAIYNMI